jgi:hypothetical protein
LSNFHGEKFNRHQFPLNFLEKVNYRAILTPDPKAKNKEECRKLTQHKTILFKLNCLKIQKKNWMKFLKKNCKLLRQFFLHTQLDLKTWCNSRRSNWKEKNGNLKWFFFCLFFLFAINKLNKGELLNILSYCARVKIETLRFSYLDWIYSFENIYFCHFRFNDFHIWDLLIFCWEICGVEFPWDAL